MYDKRILVITYIDFFTPIKNYFGNSGDTVYYTAGISYFYSKKINAKFITKKNLNLYLEKNPNWVKSNFDICIMFEANIFSEFFKDVMILEANLIKKMQIPTFVLGAGVQSDKHYSLDFVNNIKENVKLYLDAIFSSGGNITLRGDFTKFVLETITDYKFFVSGCPSMYFNGRDLKISNEKVDKEFFIPMLNAHRVQDLNTRIYKNYPKSVYFDQDNYLESLYTPQNITDYDLYKQPFKYLYANNRINGDMNYYPWIQEIINGQFNFSYGSRIHGNFVALQNSIPAFIKIIDSRVRELAEFYNIPNSGYYNFNEATDDLYNLYLDLNYDKFNNTFSEKYDNFVNFLNSNNIPNIVGENIEYKEYISSLKYFNYRTDSKVINEHKNLVKRLSKSNLYKFVKPVKIKKEQSRIVINILGIKISYEKYIQDKTSQIEFYLIDAFEIYHFLPIYNELLKQGIKTRIVAEPCKINTSGKWFDYNTAIRILEENNIDYCTKCNPNAKIAITTQTVDILSKYKNKKVNFSYGFGFSKNYFNHHKNSIKGFDIKFVHGPYHKKLAEQYNLPTKIIEFGYPKHANFISKNFNRKEALKELGVTTNKKIITYFPTWDDDASISKFANAISDLRQNYFIITKAHHCTFRLVEKKADLETLYQISDLVLDGNFNFEESALLGDIALIDTKSGASTEVPYLNKEISVLLLSPHEDLNKFLPIMTKYFKVVTNPCNLEKEIQNLENDKNKLLNSFINEIYADIDLDVPVQILIKELNK